MPPGWRAPLKSVTLRDETSLLEAISGVAFRLAQPDTWWKSELSRLTTHSECPVGAPGFHLHQSYPQRQERRKDPILAIRVAGQWYEAHRWWQSPVILPDDCPLIAPPVADSITARGR